MSKDIKYRTGINDNPLTESEFTRLKSGGCLYRRVIAPERPQYHSEENIAM